MDAEGDSSSSGSSDNASSASTVFSRKKKKRTWVKGHMVETSDSDSDYEVPAKRKKNPDKHKSKAEKKEVKRKKKTAGKESVDESKGKDKRKRTKTDEENNKSKAENREIDRESVKISKGSEKQKRTEKEEKHNKSKAVSNEVKGKQKTANKESVDESKGSDKRKRTEKEEHNKLKAESSEVKGKQKTADKESVDGSKGSDKRTNTERDEENNKTKADNGELKGKQRTNEMKSGGIREESVKLKRIGEIGQKNHSNAKCSVENENKMIEGKESGDRRVVTIKQKVKRHEGETNKPKNSDSVVSEKTKESASNKEVSNNDMNKRQVENKITQAKDTGGCEKQKSTGNDSECKREETVIRQVNGFEGEMNKSKQTDSVVSEKLNESGSGKEVNVIEVIVNKRLEENKISQAKDSVGKAEQKTSENLKQINEKQKINENNIRVQGVAQTTNVVKAGVKKGIGSDDQLTASPMEELVIPLLQQAQNERLILDIGGKRFETSRITLQREPNSLLAEVVSEGGMAPRNGNVFFLDRDPAHFRFVLNFHRIGKCDPMTLPEDLRYLYEMYYEAVYYRLPALVDSIVCKIEQVSHNLQRIGNRC